MRISTFFGAAVLTVLLVTGFAEVQAQIMMPLPPHYTNYGGMVRGYWFTAPCDFFMLGVRVPTDASSAEQSIHVMRLPAPPPAYAGCTSTYQTLGYWGMVPGTAIIPMKEMIYQGDVIGILGYRGTTNSYSANGPHASNIFGLPVSLARYLYQGNITTGPAGCCSEEVGYNISRVEMYYGAACEVPDGNLFVSLVDVNGQSQAYSEIPGNVYVKYEVRYPDAGTDVSITVDFYLVGGSTTTPVFSATVNDVKQPNVILTGQQMITVPSGVPAGYYQIRPTVNSKNSCDEYQDSELSELTFMLVDPGTQPCIVWPGDVNNDGVVNYGDKKSLNTYIHDANLNTLWLFGPARYRSDAATNPLTYLEWVAQAAVPWYTPEGCYMDSDGNGEINSWDYIGMKTNWMRDHGQGSGKDNDANNPNSYQLAQNFPNPFNPSTQLSFRVPEASKVNIVVVDMLGRQVATIVDRVVPEGTHTHTFNAAGMQSGAYTAVATMTGQETGMTYTRTIKMTLTK
jgi:hypothetical protein